MLSPRWRKVWRDVRGSRSRTLLVVLSIAIGAAAVGATMAARAVITSEIDRQYLASVPPSAVLLTSPVGEGVVERIRALPEVAAAEGRGVLQGRLQDRDGDWHNVAIFAPADIEQTEITIIRPERGAWPPGPGEILLERSSVSAIGIATGNETTFESPDGRRYQVRVAGSAHDQFRVPTRFSGYVYAYATAETLVRLGQEPGYDEVAILAAEDPYTHESARTVAALARDLVVEAEGHTVYSADIQDPGEHRTEWVVAPLTLLLAMLGGLSLLLAMALVISTVSALLAQQVRQIGVMKAIGARTGQIMTMYLGLAAIYGMLALVVAIPLGLAGGWWLARFVLTTTNFNPAGLRLVPEALALQVVVGLLVPLAATLFPVLSGTRINVREAVTSYGTTGAGRANPLARAAARLRWLPRPLSLAFRNTFRQRRRLALTLVTLNLSGAIFIAITSVRGSLFATLDDVAGYWDYDVEVVFGEPQPVAAVEEAGLAIDGVESVEGWAYKNTFYLRPGGGENENVHFFGVPPESAFLRPGIVEGRWIEGPGEVVINADFSRDEAPLGVGDDARFKVEGHDFDLRVVGVITTQLIGPVAYMDYGALTSALGEEGLANRALFGLASHDPAAQEAAASGLETRLRAQGLPVISVDTNASMRDRIGGMFSLLVYFLLVMAVLLAVVGALNLMGSMTLNVLERTREIGIMRAIGATNGALLQVVVAEGLFVGLLSWLLATVVAAPLGLLLSNAVGNAFLYTPLRYAFSWIGVLAWLGIALFMSLFATILPARRASRLSVREVLGYE